MKTIVKNKQIQEMLEFEEKYDLNNLTLEEQRKVYPKLSLKETIMHIFYGYYQSLSDLVENSEYKMKLDLTYDTVGGLLTAVVYEMLAGKPSGYSLNETIEIAEKTIASYLMLLAMNEHNALLNIIRSIEYQNESFDIGIRWATALKVLIANAVSQFDFLEAIHGKVKMRNGEIRINPRQIADKYKNLTGVDLYSYEGFDECLFTF